MIVLLRVWVGEGGRKAEEIRDCLAVSGEMEMYVCVCVCVCV